jgi:hypothetical protein
MTDIEDDFKDDEVINIKLPRAQYEVLKQMIRREQAYGWFASALKSYWLWVVGSGILTLLLLYDRMQGFGGIK